jgi:hypothetical protein
MRLRIVSGDMSGDERHGHSRIRGVGDDPTKQIKTTLTTRHPEFLLDAGCLILAYRYSSGSTRRGPQKAHDELTTNLREAGRGDSIIVE